MVKFYLDAGHGGSDPGAVGNGLLEKVLTLKIAKRVETLLTAYQGVQTKMSRTDDTYQSLSNRTNEANSWGADYFISFHINAGGGTGYEDFVYPGSDKSVAYQNIIHAEIIKTIGTMKNRGKKQANFQVLRNTIMPSILTECGFIDSAWDATLLKQDEFINGLAQGHVNGLVKAFGLLRNKVVGVANEPTLNAAQEKVRQEAMKLGITDGLNPFREVNQYYVWNALLPLVRQIEELKTKLK